MFEDASWQQKVELRVRGGPVAESIPKSAAVADVRGPNSLTEEKVLKTRPSRFQRGLVTVDRQSTCTFRHDGNVHVIVKVLADSGQIHDKIDVDFPKMAFGTDAEVHQDLRTSNGTSKQNNFPFRPNRPSGHLDARCTASGYDVPFDM